MRNAMALLCLCVPALAQSTGSPAGTWISDAKYFDNHRYNRMELTVEGTKLSGKFGRDAIEGMFQNGRIEATVKPNSHVTIQLHGQLAGDRITGSGSLTQDAEHTDLSWEARRVPARPASPQTHTFEPTRFEHFFSASIEPVLHISPGDSVKTWSVDAGGTDPKGVHRT